LGERLLTDKEWSESKFWNLEDWGGFWVPYEIGKRLTLIVHADLTVTCDESRKVKPGI